MKDSNSPHQAKIGEDLENVSSLNKKNILIRNRSPTQIKRMSGTSKVDYPEKLRTRKDFALFIFVKYNVN